MALQLPPEASRKPCPPPETGQSEPRGVTNPAHRCSSKCQQIGTLFTHLRQAVQFVPGRNIKSMYINNL